MISSEFTKSDKDMEDVDRVNGFIRNIRPLA